MNKTCITCKVEHPVEFFYKHPDTKDGLRKACKNCVSIKSYGKEHQGTISEFNRKKRTSPEFEDGTKICSCCKIRKNKNEFRKESNKRWKSLTAKCAECIAFSVIKRNFGINKEEYLNMFADQNGVCAICKNPEPIYSKLPVDHCHTTGKIRGLLCSFCNKGLGSLKDNIEYLKSAIVYLENSKETK